MKEEERKEKRNPDQITKPSERRKRKKKKKTKSEGRRRSHLVWKEKEKEEEEETHAPNPLKKEKNKKRWSKVAVKVWQWVPPCSVIYENAIKLWVMEIENSKNVFSASITHNSKIRELSDRNRVMVMPNGLLAMGPTIF